MLHSAPRFIFTIIVVLAILWLTLASQPLGDVSVPLFPGADKVVHGCMFGGLMFVIELDYARWQTKRRNLVGGAALMRWRVALATALFVCLFGGAIELLQDAMAIGRGAEIRDFAADCLGVAIALVASPPVVEWLLNLQKPSR